MKTKTTTGKIKALLLCFLIVYCTPLFAEDLTQLRKNFLYAEAAIKKGDMTEYQRLKPGLADYPLYPYLLYAEIERGMRHGLPTAQVKSFMATYPNSYLANRLQTNWLQALAKQQQWTLYQQFYQPVENTELQCYAIWAEYKNSQDNRVLAQATPLWVQGNSQPDGCNALFTAWQKSAYFSSEQAWQRAKLAASAKQATLVAYLKRYLPQTQQTMLDTWAQVQKKPELITSSALFKQKDPFMQTIQIEGLKRLISQDSAKAETTWTNLQKNYTFTPEQRGAISYAFAIQYSAAHDDKALTWLNAVPAAQTDTAIYEWRVRYALRRQDWQNALNQIKRMPVELQQQPLWRYWQGRALLALNQKNAANAILEPLAKERNYHGMLASDLIGKSYSLNAAPYSVSAATQKTLDNNPGIQRAREFYALNRITDARREWDATTASFNETQLQAAAKLARDMNWYDRSILTATKAENRNDLNVRFPLGYASDMKKAANRQNISTAWAFAITRQESAFLYDAQSPANAVGLMQLLPTTAAQVAKQTGQSYKQAELIVPAKNIHLGTAYLKELSTKFNSPLLATAAYNAGASRVYRWLPDEKMPTDVWVETIPYKETRNYVQNVFSYKAIYQHQLGETMQRLNHHSTFVSP